VIVIVMDRIMIALAINLKKSQKLRLNLKIILKIF